MLTREDLLGLSGPKALARALALMGVLKREDLDTSGGSAFDVSGMDDQGDSVADVAYLLTRDVEVRPPASAAMPTLSALMDTSRLLSGVLLDGDVPAAPSEVTSDAAVAAVVRGVVAERLVAAAARTTGLPALLLERLRRLEELLGINVVDAITAGMATEHGSVAGTLCGGARVCFTGTAVDPDGRAWAREEMRAAAGARGLVPVDSVTKSRCDVLVVAEVGTQSGKARKAKELGKPVFSADEFFAWLIAGR